MMGDQAIASRESGAVVARMPAVCLIPAMVGRRER
jgi:hypothetical protein